MSDTRIRGRIHAIEPTKMFGQKGFRKRLVVLEQDNGRFVNYIPIDFLGDSCDDVDQLKVGDEIVTTLRDGSTSATVVDKRTSPTDESS